MDTPDSTATPDFPPTKGTYPTSVLNTQTLAVPEMMEGVPKESKTEFEWAMFISIWGFVLLALPALYMSIRGAHIKKEIIENQVYETATISGIEMVRRSRPLTLYVRFHYRYSYQNQVFEYHVDYKYQRYFVNFTKDKWSLIEGTHFPVILSSEDPSKHRILIFWSDFSQFNLPFPDSLKWSEKVFYNKMTKFKELTSVY